MVEGYKGRIFSISSEQEFQELAIQAFQYQAQHVEVYARFIQALGVDVQAVKEIQDIPFLPIEFFRTHRIIDADYSSVMEFHSSGSTSDSRSIHHVVDPLLYERSFKHCFQRFFGNPEEYIILALLPSYIERPNSSLVYMVSELIRLSAQPLAGFFSEPNADFLGNLHAATKTGSQILVIGVSFALLDWATSNPISIPQVKIMETGGMKGRGKEIVRAELHDTLKRAFSVKTILSEYGMTELLSQAYAFSNGELTCPPWMRVFFRDPLNPTQVLNSSGGINIVDLANIHSCCFIATQDLGEFSGQGFSVSGRFDHSDARGCNLLFAQ
jgi:hypothetical protein